MVEDDDVEISSMLTSVKPDYRVDKKKRMGVGRIYVKRAADQAWIVKHFDDPDEVLTKNVKSRILKECQDSMDTNVVYSLNRKNRWNTTDVITMLSSSTSSDVKVYVTESIYTRHDSYKPLDNSNVHTTHTVDDHGYIRSRHVRGRGKALRHLIKEDKKINQDASISDLKNDDKDDLKLVYRFIKTHTAEREVFGRLRSWKDPKRRRDKTVDVSHLEPSFLDHLESSSLDREDGRVGSTRSRDMRFCLADFFPKGNDEEEYEIIDLPDCIEI